MYSDEGTPSNSHESDRMDLPLVYSVHQRPQQPEVADVPGTVAHELRRSRLGKGPTSAGRVGIAVGSRGIANIGVIAKAAVETLKGLGWQPFILAAMGSHGGATPAGQRELLASYGITAAT